VLVVLVLVLVLVLVFVFVLVFVLVFVFAFALVVVVVVVVIVVAVVGVAVSVLLANTGGLAAGTPAAFGGSASPTGQFTGGGSASPTRQFRMIQRTRLSLPYWILKDLSVLVGMFGMLADASTPRRQSCCSAVTSPSTRRRVAVRVSPLTQM